MKKNFKNIFAISLLSLAVLGGCKDNVMEEIKTLNTERTFSATGLTATVLNKVNVRLTWAKVANAKSYTVEIYDNQDLSGTPVKTITDIKYDQLPYTVTGLAGATTHSVRVKAISSTGVEDSKWVSVTFKTDAEQILNTVNAGDITASTVKVTWAAATEVTKLVFNPGNITYTLTATDIASGNATVSGLTAETLYTVAIYNGNVQRGTATFTTGVDVSAFTQVYSDADLTTALAAAGPVKIALHPGTYTLTSDITANKNITIVGTDAGNKPTINRAVFKMDASAALTLNNVKLDGNQASNTNQLVVYNTVDVNNTYGALSILNSEVYNYQKGLIYINKKALVEAIAIENSLIHDINCTGGGFIDMRTGFAKVFTMKNNSIYNITEDNSRDLFRIDNTANFNTQTGNKLIIENNTFYNALNRAAGRLFNIRLVSLQVYFNKNIVANTDNYYYAISSSQYLESTIAEMQKNNYHNAPNLYGSTTTNAINDKTANGYTTLDPGFTAAATGNFTVTNADLKATKIGDVRWIN